ncbi:MAG: hypothetical protein PHO02_04095 [Candidatus Nanoarchaeia archaeon]|nr:hypothetical protein [Candidatus Nanoarchaeia archaeon]
MKKALLAGIVMLLLLSSMAAARQTVVTKANEMKIDLLRYDPSPVQPGDTTDVWFEIINLKDVTINDFDVTFVEDYPFKLVSDKSIHFSRLDAGSKIQFRFTVEVNSNANEASHNVFIQYYSRTAGLITSEPFVVTVKRLGSIVSTSVGVMQSEGEIERIAPGAMADVAVAIENTQESVMKNVRVAMDLSAAAMPFAPVGMSTEQKIKQINAGSSASLTFKLVALPDAAAGVYKIPLTIEYYDDAGDLHTISDIVGVVVGAEPRISVALDSTELTKSAKTGNLVLKIINHGTEDVKFAKIKINAGTGFSLLSASEVYIGNVDSDDYETADFRVAASSDSFTIPAEIVFMDSSNKEYTELQDVEITLYTPKELGVNGGNTWMYIALLVLIIGAYIGYRKYKSRKQK